MSAPVWIASGCGGTGHELLRLGGLAGVAGLVTRPVLPAPNLAGTGARLEESPAGLVHVPGTLHPGIDGFLARELPELVAAGVPTVVQVGASDVGGHVEVVRRLAATPGVTGVELDLHPRAGRFNPANPAQAAELVDAVRRELPAGCELWAKISAGHGDATAWGRAVVDHGATAVVVTGSVDAALADGSPGQLVGPAIAPVTRRVVAEMLAALAGATVVAGGGVADPVTARDLLAAGASAVQIGSGLLQDPLLAAKVAAELGEA